MKKSNFYFSIFVMLICISCSNGVKELTPEQISSEKDLIKSNLNDLIQCYATENVDKMSSFFADSPDFIAHGSDKAEFFTTPEGMKNQLKKDFLLLDSIKTGNPGNSKIWLSKYGDLASSYVELPVSGKVGGAPLSFDYRLSITWIQSNNDWKIIQWAASAPSSGQSADELLKMMETTK